MSKKPAGHPGFERALEAALEEADLRGARKRELGEMRKQFPSPPKSRGVMPKSPYRSQLETDYAARLEMQRLAGEILWWAYEPFTLHLGGIAGTKAGVKYRIDFLVLPLSMFLEIHETKGFFRRGERERLKLAAAFSPFKVKAITREAGEWKEEEF